MRLIKSKFTALVLWICCSLAVAADSDVLLNHKWSLVILNNVPLQLEKFPAQKPYLQFAKDSSFTAYLGCNLLSGSFTTTGAKGLSLIYKSGTPTATPNVACTPANQALENDFIAMLKGVVSWKTEENTLNFLNANNSTLAIFVNVEPY